MGYRQTVILAHIRPVVFSLTAGCLRLRTIFCLFYRTCYWQVQDRGAALYLSLFFFTDYNLFFIISIVSITFSYLNYV